MRKIGYALLIVIIFFIGYGIVGEIIFTPLRKKDIELLFPDYAGKIEVSYHKDFIGWSRGDFFELYIYDLDSVHIESNYPKIGKEWEHAILPDPLIPDDLIITKWQKCPVDTSILSKYDRELTWITDSEVRERKMLKQDLKDATNYYCCIYVSGIEKYFLLYNPSNSTMYYLRQKGF